MLGFVDDLNAIGKDKANVVQNTSTLVNKTKSLSWINDKKTNLIELLSDNNQNNNM